MKTKPFFENLSEFNFECRKLAQTPPWLIKPLNIDVSLTNFVSKKESPTVLLSLANDNIMQCCPEIDLRRLSLFSHSALMYRKCCFHMRRLSKIRPRTFKLSTIYICLSPIFKSSLSAFRALVKQT
jgi:hypothetical protein